MKAEPVLQQLEGVKERLAAEANGDTRRFLDQMEAWLEEHPHVGPVVNSPEELQARLRAREATEPPPPRGAPYRFTIRSLPRCIAHARSSIENSRPGPWF
jgi:hypothetical protein